MELAFEPDRARRWALADEAIALAREAADPRTLAAVARNSCYAYWAPDTLANRAERVRELSALVPGWAICTSRSSPGSGRLSVAIELGDFARADAALERVQAIAEQTRQPTHRWRAGFLAGSLTVSTRGELEAASGSPNRRCRLGQEVGEADAAMFYGATIVQLRLYQGRAPR